MGLSQYMPVMLEDILKKNGGEFVKADSDWGEKVCVAKGGRLITGQNPASCEQAAQKVLLAVLANILV